MPTIKLQAITSFHEKVWENSLFISDTTYKIYNVCKDYCITHHDEPT